MVSSDNKIDSEKDANWPTADHKAVQRDNVRSWVLDFTQVARVINVTPSRATAGQHILQTKH
jgi:hypothetical protein